MKAFLIYFLGFSLMLAGCQAQSELEDVSGDLQVLISDTTRTSEKKIKPVTLKGIQNLKNVSGKYARFYYSPASTESQLMGSAPKAQFVKSNGVYIPTNSISQQMATLYYHIQQLTDFAVAISPDLKPTRPMPVGLSTLLPRAEGSKNNAFFDGQTQALLFVPYNLENLPITVNAGIVAHEFFHSLFYTQVLQSYDVQTQKWVASDDFDSEGTEENIRVYNETYIRGLNEGLADFWGWVYSSHNNYIIDSLPSVKMTRSLDLKESEIGAYCTQDQIEDMVQEAVALSKQNPGNYLTNYIYKIGTPQAKFLKQLTEMYSVDNEISLKEAQIIIARQVYKFMVQIQKNIVKDISKPLPANSLFLFFKNSSDFDLNLGAISGPFVEKYE